MPLLAILDNEPLGPALVAALESAGAIGATRHEALRLIREGIELHVQELRVSGQPVPSSGVRLEVVDVDAA